MLKKIAVIRSNTSRACPFGLSVTIACQNAGDSVEMMEPLPDVDMAQKEEQKKANIAVYALHATGKKCIYADKIVEGKDVVHCDWMEGGQKINDFPIPATHRYPRIFNGIGHTAFYSYPIETYWDNPGSRQMFDGMYSLYASTGEVLINKTANSNPDSNLLNLLQDFELDLTEDTDD